MNDERNAPTPAPTPATRTLAAPSTGSSARAGSPSFLPQPSPTPLAQASSTVPDVPAVPRATLSVPTPSNRPVSPSTTPLLAPIPSIHTPITSTHTLTTVLSKMDVDTPVELPAVPQVQASAAGTKANDFDYRISESGLPVGDTIEINAEGSTTDPSAKVMRSKSTVELRSTLANVAGPSLESLAASPAPSLRSPTSMASVTDTSAPTSPVHSASSSALHSSNESSPGTTIRRSRSAGYDRLSARNAESVAMHIPSPRICGVAISPTGKLIYFQTLHCKNPVLPSVSSPQLATTSSSDNPTSITSSTSPETSTEISMESAQSSAYNTTAMSANQPTSVYSPRSDKSPRRTTRMRTEVAADTIVKTTKASDGSDSPSDTTATDGRYSTEENAEGEAEGSPSSETSNITTNNSKDQKSPEDPAKGKLKDKLKYKIKDLLKGQLKYKIGKSKTKPIQPSSFETTGSFIGEYNLATFKIGHPADDSTQTSGDTTSGGRIQSDRDSAVEGGAGAANRTSETTYSGENDVGSYLQENDDSSSGDGSECSGESTEDDPNDGIFNEEEDSTGPVGLTLKSKSNAVNNTIHSILNRDPKPASHLALTLPFFGVFPRTYPELTTIIHGCKVANQFTTTDTVVLAQLKSLNSVSLLLCFLPFLYI